MKARVEVVIRDEEGNILSQLAPAWMELGAQSLHDIEGAVETWKQQALPEIEADLLSSSSKPIHSRDKKTVNSSVTAHDWCGLRQYMESSCFLYKNTSLMHKKPIIWL
jgi:hypothetical protein